MNRLYDGVPYEYSKVVGGGVVFTAGACPLDERGEVVAPGDQESQARQALANLLAALAERGAGAADLVRTTVYVVGDRPDLVAVWNVVAAGLEPHRPPSTLDRSGRWNHVGELIGGPLDQLTMLRLVASPLPGRALSVVHEAKRTSAGQAWRRQYACGCPRRSR